MSDVCECLYDWRGQLRAHYRTENMSDSYVTTMSRAVKVESTSVTARWLFFLRHRIVWWVVAR
jgi:hypothetical protein